MQIPVAAGVFMGEARTRVRRGRSRAHQMAALARTTQPIIRLAAIIAKLDMDIPQRRGMTREVLLAYMIMCGDWRSGKRSRPGRPCSSKILGREEDSVRKMWRELEGLGILVRTAKGRFIPHAEVKLQDPEDYHVADRSEWTVPIPKGVYAEDITQAHVDRAVKAFALLAERLAVLDADLAPITEAVAAMTEGWRNLIDTRASQAKDAKFCLIYGFINVVVRSKHCSKSLPRAGKPDKTKSSADLASLGPRSATKSQAGPARKVRRRRMDPDAVALARSLRTEKRLPQLRHVKTAQLAATVDSRAKAGWTAWDVAQAVAEAVQRRRDNWGVYKVDVHLMRPTAWLKTLLAEVTDRYPVERPPHVQAEALSAAAREATAAAQAERAAYEARRAERATGYGTGRPRIVVPRRRPAQTGPGPLAGTAADPRNTRGRERAVDVPAPRSTQTEWPVCRLCANPGPDVEHRFIPRLGAVACCGGCEAWHTANPPLPDLGFGL